MQGIVPVKVAVEAITEYPTMTKLSIQDRADIQAGIEGYTFIHENGRLDLNDFCSTLRSCFDFDGVLHLSPNPRDMFNLLVQIITDEEGEAQAKMWVQTQGISDWTPAVAYKYPEKFRTLIHLSALVSHSHKWIYAIGSTLMNLPDSETDPKYYAWVKEEWFFTHMFIEGFHNKLYDFMQTFDAKMASRGGHSSFEALHLSVKNNIDFHEAVSQLTTRNDARRQAIERIELAIQSGFYLEAITLEECFISNCIYNFLVAKNEISKEVSFAELLKKMVRANVSASADIKKMFASVDAWRSRRNSSIHGFISSRSSELLKSTEEFLSFSKETGETGQRLCEQVNIWYANESARFKPVQFSRSTAKPLH